MRKTYRETCHYEQSVATTAFLMRLPRRALILLLVTAVSLIGLSPGFASDEGVLLFVPPDSPIFADLPVAIINDEYITLKELHNAAKERISNDVDKSKKIEYSDTLNNLINISLIVQEARNIGINELPEIKDFVEAYSRVTLRELLMEEHVKDMKADEAEVDKLYKEAAKEWKIKSVFFEKEDDAKNMLQEIKEGGSFDELLKKAIASETAKGDIEGHFLKPEKLLPQIVDVVSKMEAGSLSPVIQTDSGFIVVKLEEIRYPEDLKAKEWAIAESLNHKKGRSIEALDRELKKKYTKVNKKIFDSLNYESEKPGIEKLLKDKRVIAEIKGENPITVADISSAIKQKFYHGIERAAEGRKINERKIDVLGELLHKRVFRKEALKKEIHKTEKYKDMVRAYEESMIFGAFVQRVIVPEVRLNLEETQKYYDEHIDEYAFPEMLRINSLVFSKRENAEEAVEKLQKGTDFKWLRETADGQTDKDAPGLLKLDGNVLILKDLPDDMQKVLSGVNAGDSRLYASPDNIFYALYIQEVIPSKKQPFEAAKETVAKKVFQDKINKTINDWTDKLREASDIIIYFQTDRVK